MQLFLKIILFIILYACCDGCATKELWETRNSRIFLLGCPAKYKTKYHVIRDIEHEPVISVDANAIYRSNRSTTKIFIPYKEDNDSKVIEISMTKNDFVYLNSIIKKYDLKNLSVSINILYREKVDGKQSEHYIIDIKENSKCESIGVKIKNVSIPEPMDTNLIIHNVDLRSSEFKLIYQNYKKPFKINFFRTKQIEYYKNSLLKRMLLTPITVTVDAITTPVVYTVFCAGIFITGDGPK